jgi:uncharacterized protein (DUF488 family)
MEIYSIGFTQKSAGQFFDTLKVNGIERLLDVRLNNTSQLAGFAKQADLAYFLQEICNCSYEHEPLLAPEQEMLDSYKKLKGSWDIYAEQFMNLMHTRKIESAISQQSFNRKTVLLCSEPTAEHCHRRLVLEYLQLSWKNVIIRHL